MLLAMLELMISKLSTPVYDAVYVIKHNEICWCNEWIMNHYQDLAV